MELAELKTVMQKNGIVGAGGAGFPSYAKLDSNADTVILNCCECEPLLKLHTQVLQKYAYEVLSALNEIVNSVGAKAIVAIKSSYKTVIEAVNAQVSAFKNISVYTVPDIYPAGDEIVLIKEVTGRVVKAGNLPISVGVTVFNVETVFNVYKALNEQTPCIEKYVTVTGAVKNPLTVIAPIGTSFEQLINLAGGETVADTAIIKGGPMTGRLSNKYDVVTKTTNAIIVLPETHRVVAQRRASVSSKLNQTMSVCCQCRMCTDLCPRHLLGHTIEPHRLMRAVATHNTSDIEAFVNTKYCSQCGLCEMYSCPQGLSPRTLIGEFRSRLTKAGADLNKSPCTEGQISEDRKYRLVSSKRLKSRLGLSKYDSAALLTTQEISPKKVKIPLSQHIGVPAVCCVCTGQKVSKGDVIAEAAEGKLSVCIHASISGEIGEVNDKYIIINRLSE
ncbi:MAG: SLBB domain-containing protein [bacterium]|nr:SLBB domain-containing protein [bacterium]